MARQYRLDHAGHHRQSAGADRVVRPAHNSNPARIIHGADVIGAKPAGIGERIGIGRISVSLGECRPADRDAALENWEQAPSARLSHPPRAEEHLLPLFVAAGAAEGAPGKRVFSDRVMETTLSAFRFG